jgi:Fimbrial assembly protein (PilN)
MKDIDFLPEWYRSGQRRQVSYRTQCIALGGVFVTMIVWSLIARHSISRAEAELAGMAANHGQAENVSVELAGLESELSQLQQRAKSIEEMKSRIDVASILAELSYLIDERVVLSKVELTAEKFAPERKAQSGPGGNAVVRPVQAVAANRKNLPLGKVRFKVMIAGVAADASDVGVLMCKLEDSPYFGQVVLVFSRDTEIAVPKAPLPDTGTAGENATTKTAAKTKKAPQEKDANIKASEFEIQCYLANYRES